ncbi:glycosyltransferase family 2 protein [Lichenicoccus sp.]|uniref:glycosyltransferase family 2 protein n=1 Tax=Lichenicoccus sp. TaxID=2781899 RepID=UPI003D09A992
MYAQPQTIGVLICSYRRPDSLLRGLAALAAQTRMPDDVLVVARADDAATLEALAARPLAGPLPLRVLTVSRPGTVHALNTGLESCRTDVLAITDDDTVPHPDWLARILAHFSKDPALGGVGGRDWCHDGARFEDRGASPVGRLQWFGRTIGNHHLGIGAPRDVDFLKGANMSYRAAALGGMRFDTRLCGTGAQPYEDIAFSLAVRRAGWKLLYDPLVAVDHYAATREEPRHYAGVAKGRDLRGLSELAHNEVVALWPSLTPAGRVAYVVWSVLVGTGTSPGLVQAIRYVPRLGTGSWRRFGTVQRAKMSGYRSLRQRGSRGTPALAAPRGAPSGTAIP